LFEADQPWSKPRLPSIRERIHERLGELAHRLGGAQWLDGAFSAGDLLMVAVLRALNGTGILDGYPTLKAYVDRGEARPAFKSALDAQMAGFTGEAPPEFREWEARRKARSEPA
jgi:glutathione S-transferase